MISTSQKFFKKFSYKNVCGNSQNQQLNSCCTRSKVTAKTTTTTTTKSKKSAEMANLSLLCLICIAFVAVSANVVPVKRSHLPAVNQHGQIVWLDEKINPVPDKCDFSCSDRDIEVCAHNGQCLQMFTSRCTMAAYNCRNPQKRFNIVENYRCTQGYVPLCTKSEHKELGLSP